MNILFDYLVKKPIVIFLILAIKSYQISISQILAPCCRFYPSCSEYAICCLRQYSLFYACQKIAHRLWRCRPTATGGVDLP